MKYKRILVTGGSGFVGSYICIQLKEQFKNIEVIALDNLYRKGSELNVPRLQNNGVIFVKGDVRNKKDLEISDVDLLIECSAEPSVMAGITSSPDYLLETNINGAINCFERARRIGADVLFLSTSRVYPMHTLNSLEYVETDTRFALKDAQKITGASTKGISEAFSLEGTRSLYGTTKLSAELLLQEYCDAYQMKAVINRCGLLAGPWQMGKVDQGVITYWMARHVFNKPLRYIGFGGKGKQVRDVLHVNDLFNLILIQLEDINAFSGKVYNVGGGDGNSISLLELTKYCQEISGNTVPVESELEDRVGDVRVYITDNTKIEKQTGWIPKKSMQETLEEIHKWVINNKDNLHEILN